MEVDVKHGNKSFIISIKLVDGKPIGGYKSMATSYLSYFNNCSDKVREKHFKEIEEYLTNNLK